MVKSKLSRRFCPCSFDVYKNYFAAILVGILILIAISYLGQMTNFMGGALTAAFFVGLSYVRNTYLEAQLKAALESGLNYSTTAFDEFHVMIRNTTWVAVTIREIRLRKSLEKRSSGRLVRMQYRGPSYFIMNQDPDEPDGDFLPHSYELPWVVKARMGILQPGENYQVRFSPEAGDFHTVAPETGVIYALPIGVCKQFLTDDIHECLIVVEYPTIWGRSKVLVIKASEHSIRFVQDSLRRAVPMMEKQAKEMLELHGGGISSGGAPSASRDESSF